jgi:hypothetical protein
MKHRARATRRLREGEQQMKTPVVWVTAALTAAIVLTASFVIATGTRGENTSPILPTERILRVPPAGK